jgi:4-diphosphocytidyl-2C-methyl-D-erythritol kinase
MRDRISKTKKSKDGSTLKSKKTNKIVTEDDIRKRAFEIYKENYNSSSNELDNWYCAERELSGYYK